MVDTLNKYLVRQIKWAPEYEKEIETIYNMLKDQQRKIFDLSFYGTGGDVMDYVEDSIKENMAFVVGDFNGEIFAFFILENPRLYKDIITRVDVHTAIRKRYWGKQSREIISAFKDYLMFNFKIKKFVATVPQCGYGVIKLLKDIGFKHEGTLKDSVIFLDKNDNPKFYDELIYSLTNEDIKL